MRVGLLSYNGHARDAIGNLLAEKLAFFIDRGADARVFLQSSARLHPALGRHCEVVDKVQNKGPIWDYLAGADLVSFEYSQAYDLLHFLPMLAGGKPRLVVDYHGVTPARYWPAPRREALEQGRAQRGLVWCADHVLVHSRYMRAELVQATNFPNERVWQIDFPLSEAFCDGIASWSLRAHLGLGAARVLLFVGRLAPNKNLPLLIEAVARMGALTPAVHAVIVGDASDVYGDEERRCRELARRSGVHDRVHFVGSVADKRLADCYRDADVFVMPSSHEGFCIPILEAQACGLPIIAARATALPETVGSAGITFVPGDADDLAKQVLRLFLSDPLSPCTRGERDGVRGESIPREDPKLLHTICAPSPLPLSPEYGGEGNRAKQRSIAIVCFRFGHDIVGGAETSLRKIAQSLQRRGEKVEVFTTCTRAESAWANELPAASTRQDTLMVHRFPIDLHDRERHLQSLRAIHEAQGQVTPETEQSYVEHSIHSAALLATLRERADDFKAILAGPYLFGLTCDIAQTFPHKTLLVPCFHDEPLARLKIWPKNYGRVAGLLFHSPEERELAQTELGINHPNSVEIGTYLEAEVSKGGTAQESRSTGLINRRLTERYLIYCGRYSEQKSLPRLLEYMARYQTEQSGRFSVVFMGAGEVRIPRQDWARDLGCVDEDTKRAVLAGAAALVQLSRQESLSLVVLEAWAEGTPVIVDECCSVLAGQLGRCQGGRACADYATFAGALDDLWHNPEAWRQQGRQGQAYVQHHYSSEADFTNKILSAIAALDVPLAEQMRRRGLERAALASRDGWRERFGQIMERVLDGEPRPMRVDIRATPVRARTIVKAGSRTLIPVRIHNHGTHAACAAGPARHVVYCAIGDEPRTGETPLPSLLLPGQSQAAAVLIAAPTHEGDFAMRLWVDQKQQTASRPALPNGVLSVTTVGAAGCTGPFLETAHEAMAGAEALRDLPDDYIDVTEGLCARWKRWLKAKLIGNFKRGYVDVLSRQQSRVNRQLLISIQQLTECCATLDHALRGVQERLDRLEERSSDRECISQPSSTL